MIRLFPEFKMSADPSGSDSTQQRNTSMEQLESRHQVEIFQQQQEHLHQLQVLQAQLLQELSTHLPVGSESISDAAFPHFQQELPDVSSQQLSHGGVQPHSLPIEITASRQGDVPLSWRSAIQQQPIATSTLPHKFSPPISRSDSPREAPIQDTSSITISPAQSLEFLQLPSPVKTIPITSTATSSPTTKPASHISSLVEVGNRDVSPTDSEAMTMKPHGQSFKEQLQSGTTPPFTAFTIPSYVSLQPQPQRADTQAFSPATQGKSPRQSATQGKSPRQSDTQGKSPSQAATQGNSRTALLDKHNKHIADLKQYYETEMAGLKREMEELRLQVGMQQAPSSLWSHQEVAVETTRGEMTYELKEEVKRLKQHVLEWQSHHEASERLASVLQERLESTRFQLQQEERKVGQLQVDVQAATEELQFWREQRTHHIEKLDQLFGEFKVLQKENRTLQVSNCSLEEELYECNKEMASLRDALNKHRTQELQYKSIISKLEDEARSLRHLNNRLNSQATHYDLGSSSYVSPYNKPDEDKLHQQTPRRPLSMITTPLRSEPHPDLGRDHTPSLTRRKWLEPSDPGLICGTPSSYTPTSAVSPSTKLSPLRQPFPSDFSPILDAGMKSSSPVRSQSEMADSMLEAIRSGSIIAGDDHQEKTYRKHTALPSKQKQAAMEMSLEERVQRHMQTVADAEHRLVKLQAEKEKLESALQRAPKSRGRITHQAKQSQLEMEGRLEEVLKEIGSTKMVLRNHHALTRR